MRARETLARTGKLESATYLQISHILSRHSGLVKPLLWLMSSVESCSIASFGAEIGALAVRCSSPSQLDLRKASRAPVNRCRYLPLHSDVLSRCRCSISVVRSKAPVPEAPSPMLCQLSTSSSLHTTLIQTIQFCARGMLST